MKKTLLLPLIVFLSVLSSFAQAPQSFKYQGAIRNASGEELTNQNVKVRASILTGTVDGTSIYTETHSTTTNDFGLVSLEIGKGTPILGSFESIEWGVNPAFLKIEVDPTGNDNYILMGSSQLLSVPYALYAENAKMCANWFQVTRGIQYRPSLTSYCGIGFNKFGDADIYGIGAYDLDPNNKHPKKISMYGEHIYLNDKDGWQLYNVGIGVSRFDVPREKLEVSGGNIYVSDNGGALILKSPNGKCWRVSIDDNGEFVKTEIPTPGQ